MTHWIYLSPHLDDAVFSCGGLIWEQVNLGDKVEIWTIFAGDPPEGTLSPFAQSLHDRWKLDREAVVPRRAEDIRACDQIGAVHRHFELPDCIYRKHPVSQAYLYDGEEKIFGGLAEIEVEMLVPALARTWQRKMPEGAQFVSPLGLGGHVDHQLVRQAVDRMAGRLQFYADVPYVFAWEAEIPALLPGNTEVEAFPISEDGMKAWIAAVSAYDSQISTFWDNIGEMEGIFRAYAEKVNGIRLWTRLG